MGRKTKNTLADAQNHIKKQLADHFKLVQFKAEVIFWIVELMRALRPATDCISSSPAKIWKATVRSEPLDMRFAVEVLLEAPLALV